MKKLYPFIAMLLLCKFSAGQLSVNTFTSSSTICTGTSANITATASPVGYTISSTTFAPYSLPGTDVLAALGVAETPLTTGTLDDGRWDNITLPFSFTFYGNIFNNVNISTNGWIGLGSTNSTTTGMDVILPSAGAPNNVIHALTSDLTFVSGSGSLEYFTTGAAPNRRFIINYENVQFYSGGGTANVQVILKEASNIIEIHTTNCTNTTLGKAQGIENSDGTVASVITGRNNTTTWASASTTAYSFTPDVISFTWSPSTGLNTTTGSSVIATPATTTTYTVTALNENNSSSGSTTITITIDPASYSLAAVPGGPAVCQNITVAPGGTSYRDGNCNLIASIVPAGASPVENSINTCTQVDVEASKMGTLQLYVARRYDIEPLLDSETATANVTLYYLQSEFDDFNTRATDSGLAPLPTAPGDASGIANMRIRQYHGTGVTPGDYTGELQTFTSLSSGVTIVWNASRSWWEVTVPVTGFSGFYITAKKGTTTVLDVSLEYFKGAQVDKHNKLTWKVNCTSDQVTFDLERSNDGGNFMPITQITANHSRCNQAFDYLDRSPLNGKNYYRLKITDVDGRFDYSNIVVLNTKIKKFELLGLNPNIVTNETTLKINAYQNDEIIIVLTDVAGRKIKQQNIRLLQGINNITLNMEMLPKGAYHLTAMMPNEGSQTLKFIKQ
jgi:hypothetical protein